MLLMLCVSALEICGVSSQKIFVIVIQLYL